MKKIEAIISPLKVETVRAALVQMGVSRIATSDIKEFGHHGAHTNVYRGTEITVDYTPEVKMELVVEDEQLDEAAAVLLEAGEGDVGNGTNLLILPIETGLEHASAGRGR